MVPSRQQRPRYETRSRHQGAEPTNGESEVMRGRGRARSRGCGRRSVSRGKGGLGRGRHCQRNLRDLPAQQVDTNQIDPQIHLRDDIDYHHHHHHHLHHHKVTKPLFRTKKISSLTVFSMQNLLHFWQVNKTLVSKTLILCLLPR